MIRDFSDENCIYLELRTTPKNTQWMDKREYVAAILEGFRISQLLYPKIVVRLILSVDRKQSIEDAKDTIELALEMSRFFFFFFLNHSSLQRLLTMNGAYR